MTASENHGDIKTKLHYAGLISLMLHSHGPIREIDVSVFHVWMDLDISMKADPLAAVAVAYRRPSPARPTSASAFTSHLPL